MTGIYQVICCCKSRICLILDLPQESVWALSLQRVWGKTNISFFFHRIKWAAIWHKLKMKNRSTQKFRNPTVKYWFVNIFNNSKIPGCQCLAIEAAQVPMCSPRCSEAASHSQLECKVLDLYTTHKDKDMRKLPRRLPWTKTKTITETNTKTKTSVVRLTASLNARWSILTLIDKARWIFE